MYYVITLTRGFTILIIESIKLNNYRNYNTALVVFKPNLNIITGKNAQGKTNLLEAIYFTAIGKSPRTNKEVDLINWKEENAKIKLQILKTDGRKTVEVFLNHENKKSIRINEINILKIADLLGVVNCVYFSPDELRLVKETPEDRRKFLDTDISQLSKNYFSSLIQYNKILAQRNKLLKEENFDTILQTLPIWDTQLAKYGAKLIFKRIKFLNKVKIYAKDSLNFLTNTQENLEVNYDGLIGETEKDIEDKLLNLLNKNHQKDIKLGFTTTGPHRDDIKLIVNGVDVKNFGSQGQQRTVALCLKLAELEIFKEEFNDYPILLLDDVLSELDIERQTRLLKYSLKTQTIITTTKSKFTATLNANIIKIENGKVIN